MSTGRVHRYRIACSWQGSTGGGYASYERAYEAVAPPAATRLALSADGAFAGDPARLNPEQLVVAAVSSCQLLSFLAVAARAGVDVLAYADDAEGLMPEPIRPVRLTEVRLRPRITVRPPATDEVVAALCESAHHECYVANSLACPVTVDRHRHLGGPVTVDPTATVTRCGRRAR